jgi:hypothetical protein
VFRIELGFLDLNEATAHGGRVHRASMTDDRIS